jgi:CCR4-NOT transcription complex subunit 7/8
MIQLGITLFNEDGEVPPATATDSNGQPYGNAMMPAPCTWQFNFRFSLEGDMYAQESTAMLAKSGIDFNLHEKNGIDPFEFGSLLISSGLVLLEDVHWVSFHSGYDFGYLMKIMLCSPLPENEEEFHKLLTIFFPSLYDIKYLMKHAGRNQAVNDSPSHKLPHRSLPISVKSRVSKTLRTSWVSSVWVSPIRPARILW